MASKFHHDELTSHYYDMLIPMEEKGELEVKMVNGNELHFFHGHLYSYQHCQDLVAHYQRIRPAMVIDTENHLYDYVRSGTTSMRDYFSKPPKLECRYDDILCKREIQNWFLREISENTRVWKEVQEPIIFQVNRVEKRNYPRLDQTAAYVVANTYQTQLGLAAPNPQYYSMTRAC